jgi:branched-chain amino acid aminotransferase
MNQSLPTHAYFDGKIVPYDEAKVGVMTHALNYGTAVFGGLRVYWNADKEQLYIFRPLEHFQRLLQSAYIMRMDIGKTATELVDILKELIRTADYKENLYVRPLIYKSTEMIGVKLHDVDDAISMVALPFGRYVEKEEGLHVCFSAWQRVSDNTIPARGKVAGAYANSALIKTDAILAGYDEALVLTTDGHLSEGSAANVLMVRNGKLVTSPVYDDILEGITRRTILQLAREELGLEVEERKIDRTEVYISDEMMMCGTGMQIAAITRVEHRNIGTGQMGPITEKLRNLYFDVVSGRVAKYQDWLDPVYVNEGIKA